MSGSRLGRGRGGRLAIYTGCLLIVVLLVFLYRAATTEMTRLRELHDQCTHQQEALAAQLQVIFEYKVRLEKSLAEEKSSNTAIKQELQQRATREKSLRDKDSIEAMQKFNSLQQQFKLLKTEHQDLKDECATTQKLAFEDKNRLETKLQDLRIQISENKKMNESLEHLKTKYLEVEVEKTKFEDKYNELLKDTGNADSRVEHLNKEVFQLKQDLKDAKTSCRSTASSPIFEKSQTSHQIAQPVIDQQIASSSSRQQTGSVTGVSRILTESGTTKSIVNSASTASDKSVQGKSVSRIKLPVGVVPIPQMIDQTNDRNEESKRIDNDKNLSSNNRHIDLKKSDDPKIPDNEIPGAIANGAKHVGAQILNRGFQEIGDEPNNFGRIPGFDGGREGESIDDQYGYDRDLPPKNDINNEENEEEEDEDEDDQIEYRNNAKQAKQE
ncbi:hypothetical protein HCN44_003510 [Aphidius gifuensis]|uniref:Uncharacterized protein n=1 Tax=Aphidius gifuensis TaxID=684658 RepID=A0A835CKW5_APHGI|nr:Golgi integral membrane protein 4-like [Aphidius gifuensis]KAF7987647.1 hypothetical protein HCN44_003510 [Aphidius gifuensis]